MRVPNEIKEKVHLASELYEKAYKAECEIREWLQQVGLTDAVEETPIGEALTEYVRFGDGSASAFIELLEGFPGGE